MSNIITIDEEKNSAKLLTSLNKYTNNIDDRSIEEIVTLLLNMSGSKTNLSIKNCGGAAMFVPGLNTIDVNPNGIDKWLIKNVDEDKKILLDKEKMKKYYTLFILSHEIEHSIQYDYAYGYRECELKILKSAYKHLLDLFQEDNSILPRPIRDTRKRLSTLLYKFNQNYYLLERNACIEAFDLVAKVSSIEDKEISNYFKEAATLFKRIGYINNNDGAIKETYRKILMQDVYNKFEKDYCISAEEKVRHGLEITETEKKLILK